MAKKTKPIAQLASCTPDKTGYCTKCKRAMWTLACPGYVTAADINPDSLRNRPVPGKKGRKK